MKALNKYFDHTLLKPDATPEQIKKLCREAEENSFYSVCVNSCYVKYAAVELKGSDVKITSVVGFPLGASTTLSKATEAKEACACGASEIDMVMNIGIFKSGDYNFVYNDIKSVVTEVSCYNAKVKVILETSLLSDVEIVKACQIAEHAGAAFVKTSTGFCGEGATVHNVSLMKSSVSEKVKVKASGGIRDFATSLKMINAGADRIGASASVMIMQEANSLAKK